MMQTIYHDAVVTIQFSNAAADNETINGVGVDMQGYDNVAFIAIADDGQAADFSIHAESAAASDYSDAADLEGTSVTFSTGTAATGYAFGLCEVASPPERYVRPAVVVPDLTALPVMCIAIQYNAKAKPVTAPTYGEFHLAPAEGTA